MKRLVTCLVLTMLVSACGKESPTPSAVAPNSTDPSGDVTSKATESAPKPRVAPGGETGAEFLAQEGVDLDFPHEVNYDILDTSRNGTPRQRVLVEVLGGDFSQTATSFTSALQGLGYRKASESAKGEGSEQVYVMEGKPTYYLLMQPAGTGPKLKNPDAVGSIHIMWNKR